MKRERESENDCVCCATGSTATDGLAMPGPSWNDDMKQEQTRHTESLVQRVVECVRKFRSCKRGEGELEVRLGNFGNGRFCPGVPRAVFEQLERDMEDAPGLSAECRYREIVDYHYVARRHETARTRVEFDTERMEVSRQHISKRDGKEVTLVRTSSSVSRREETPHRHDGDAPESEEACRVAFTHEAPLAQAPGTCMPTHVRVKQRRRFSDVRDGAVVWSYELSRTWSASSRMAVEHLQHMSEPVYEVECELVDVSGDYMATHTDEQVARSLLLKTALLMGDEEPSGLHVTGA